MKEDNDLRIDRTALDEEWLRQATLYHFNAVQLADARLDLDEAKDRLAVIEAELDLAIRQDPEKYGISKLTEKAIEHAVVLSSRYQKAKEETNQAKHLTDVLNAKVTGLDHKKKALEFLVQLENREFYSEPKAKEQWEDRQSKERREILKNKG